MSDLSEVYKHSGRWSPVGLLMPLAVLGVLSIPFGFIYAYAMMWCPLIYINLLGTGFYGFALGWVGSKLVKTGKIRNNGMAALIGAVIGFVALYMCWVGHIYAVYTDNPLVLSPMALIEEMMYLNETGTWGFSSDSNITGIMLTIVWLIEAGMIIFIPALTVFAEISDTPFCEENQVWLDERQIIDTVALFSDEDLEAAVKGDLSALARAKPRNIQDPAWMRLTLKHSPKTEKLYTMTLGVVHLSQNKDGELEEHAKDLMSDILVEHKEFEILKQFADWPIEQAPPPEMEEVQPAATDSADPAAEEPSKD